MQIYTAPFTNGMTATLTIGGLNNPLDVILDDKDNLFIADSSNHRLLFYETPLASGNTNPDAVFGQNDFSGTQANKGGAVAADTLKGALDADSNLYVSDSGNHRVLVYRAGNDGNKDATADVVFGQGGSFISGTANKGGISANSLNFPYGLTLDRFGVLFVADVNNNRVLGYMDPLTSDQTADIVYGQNSLFTASLANQVLQVNSQNQTTLGAALSFSAAL